ncbi:MULTISPECIES: hypothetical protein [unclassified Mesorhizobium]
MSEPKPIGSGVFAAVCGILFFLAFVGSFWVNVEQLTPDRLIRAWFLFVAAVLVWWGTNRMWGGRRDLTVGQETINLVVGIVAATIALLSLLKD